eukprot:gene15268-biopygen14252
MYRDQEQGNHKRDRGTAGAGQKLRRRDSGRSRAAAHRRSRLLGDWCEFRDGESCRARGAGGFLVWGCLVFWLDLVWFGLAWLGLAWRGLAWL